MLSEVPATGWRNDPIYQTLVPSRNEHIYIGHVLPPQSLLMRFAAYVSKRVQVVHIPRDTNGSWVVAHPKQKTNMAEPCNVALGTFAVHPNFWVCVVVASDVNVYGASDLMWALSKRADRGKGVFTVPLRQEPEMDPANENKGIGTKFSIDATFDKGGQPYGQCVGCPMVARVKYPVWACAKSGWAICGVRQGEEGIIVNIRSCHETVYACLC